VNQRSIVCAELQRQFQKGYRRLCPTGHPSTS
jgi:hypothetical protein